MTRDNWYWMIGGILGFIVGLVTFIGSWWYCAATYGFLLGFGLGWLPAGIAAVLAGGATFLLWGVVALALVVGLVVLGVFLARGG